MRTLAKGQWALAAVSVQRSAADKAAVAGLGRVVGTAALEAVEGIG